MRFCSLAIALVLLSLLLAASPAEAGDREFVGKHNGREVFRLCIFFSHPPFPGTVVMTAPDGSRVCTADIKFFANRASFSCVLPDSRIVSMTLRHVRGKGILWTATVDGRTFNGQICPA